MEKIKKSHVVTFLIDDDFYQKLVELSQSSDRPMGAVIRQILKAYFAKAKSGDGNYPFSVPVIK